MPGKEALNRVSIRNPEVIKFLEEASVVSLDKKPSGGEKFPPRARQTDEQYYRGFEFLGHTIGIGRSVRATGERYGTSGANVQNIRNGMIELLYRNADPKIQAKYSPQDLGIPRKKPFRSFLIGSGRQERRGRPNISEYEDAQRRIDKINNYQLTKMLKLKNPPVILIADVARLEGATFFMKDVKLFAQDLKSVRIAAGAVLRSTRMSEEGEKIPSYSYIIWAKDLVRTREHFRRSPIFQRFLNKHVEVIGPSPKRIPNINELETSRKYTAIGALIKDLRGRPYGFNPTLTMRDLITEEPPAAIYHFQGSYVCRRSQRKALLPFVEQRLRELSLL